MNDLNQIKNLYEKGYRCIKTDQKASEGMTVYLKNFEMECSEEISIQQPNEIKATLDFISNQN